MFYVYKNKCSGDKFCWRCQKKIILSEKNTLLIACPSGPSIQIVFGFFMKKNPNRIHEKTKHQIAPISTNFMFHGLQTEEGLSPFQSSP